MNPAAIGSPPRKGEASEVFPHPEALNLTSASSLCFPSSASVKGRVLGALLRGERLTHRDCWLRFGSSRLSHHVYELRRAGWPVLMAEQTVTTSDAGRKATVGIYSLPIDAIAAAGEAGQNYAAECHCNERERRAA